MIKIVDPCVSNPNDIGYLKQSNATLRLKLFDTRKKLNSAKERLRKRN